jgi:hypothetical protein
MIEIVDGSPAGILEVRATGRVTEHDYETVLIPGVEAALSGGTPVRLLFQIGPGFDGYSAGAIWADARLGMRHWRGFDRVAVVTDSDLIETAVKMFGFAMPSPVATFDLDEAEKARAWLIQTLGSIHLEEIGQDALIVRLDGKLDSSAYAAKVPELDAYVERTGRFRLLLDLRDFDGWQGLGAVGDHLNLVREHRKAPARVAVVGDKAWMKLAETVMANFLDAKTKFFDADDFEAGMAWLLA